ncbi:protocadherin beta-15-like isoform X1 [Rhincodon typus]|uniref:protocadherin beta-15-like isoform X1 n=1 Tax=Rhincodon typus TaxID=259920 RepID=UPI00202ED908|nr:protocadherin beta-15-like isoform X1 [Rhincodon typus]
MLVWSFIFLLCSWENVSGQIRYSIPEELEHGAFVGNVARDLGLDVNELANRKLRLMPEANERYFKVNLDNGELRVNVKIDREKLCGQNARCMLTNNIIIENPVELYSAEVEILDINDNSPSFSNDELRLEIVESVPLGTRFLLPSAHDPDVGTNSISAYHLNANQHFALEVKNSSDGSITAVLVLTKVLDREALATHRLTLTAIDGGTPVRSGTSQIVITVLDVDDNWPVFEQAAYNVKLPENVPIGTLVIKLNATDLDEGSNGQISYSFSSSTPAGVRDLFSLGSRMGEMRVKGVLDFEENNFYEINIEAKDSIHFAVCKVIVEITDVNDNTPEITLMSVSTPIREDAQPGTVVALMRVTDRDSGLNGQFECQIPDDLPFNLKSSLKNTYTLTTSYHLDRETNSQYTVHITCTDTGSPPLSANKTILVQISDMNDNAPRFAQLSYTVYVPENSPAGSSIGAVSALDPDQNRNSHIVYSILNSLVHNMPASAYVSITSDTGSLYSQRPFDYEELKNFQIHVQARDAGFPVLDSNVTVNIVVLDQNDNAPQIISPLTNNNSGITVPRSADPGSLVTKVVAADVDSGQNARLTYQLLQATDSGLFTIAHGSGEIRTIRRFMKKDDPIQKLVVLVKDNGHPPLSSTVTINVLVTDNSAETLSDQIPQVHDVRPTSNLAFYLIITLASTSSILLVILIVLIVTMCHSDRSRSRCCDLSPSCCNLNRWHTDDTFPNSHLYFQTVPDYKGTPHFVELVGNGSLSRTYSYKVRPNQLSSKGDFVFLAPYNTATLQNDAANTDTLLAEWRGELTNNWKNPHSEVGQMNTDWRSSEPHIVGKISSQCLEDNLNQDEVKREFSRRHTAAAEVDDIKASPNLEDGLPTWAPRFGSQHVENLEPDEYQSNIYLGGTPVMLSSRQDQVVKQDGQHSASSAKKKKKRTKRSEKRESKSTKEEPENE